MARRMSLAAKMYVGVAGSTAATEVNTVGDVTYTSKKSETQTKTRASRFELTFISHRADEVGFTMYDDDADVVLAQIVAAYDSDTPLAFKIVDKASGKGIDADWEVTGKDRDEAVDGVMTYKFTIKPTYVSRYPAAV